MGGGGQLLGIHCQLPEEGSIGSVGAVATYTSRNPSTRPPREVMMHGARRGGETERRGLFLSFAISLGMC